jgi:DHA1 family tetracycline resistance protein-like MFS transporter
MSHPGVPSRHSVTFVFITVFLDMVGMGMIIPVLPELISSVGELSLAEASRIGGWMMFTFCLVQFLLSPSLGNLSDAHGRRPLLLLSVLGLGLDYVLHAVAPSLFWLFIGRMLAGACGASHVIANAYIADITRPELRAKAFGLIGAAFGLGFVIGPALGGLLGELGPRVPFWVAAAVSFANLIYGYIVLPETLPPEKRRPFDWRRGNPVGTLRVFRQYPAVLGLCGVFFIYAFASAVYPAVWSYWGRAKLGWTEQTIGITIAAFGVVTAIFQGLLTGPLVKRLGEYRLALLGLTVAAVAAAGYGWASTLGWVIFMLVIHGPEGFVHPMLCALISKQAPEDAQGEIQGGIASIMSIAMMLATPFFASLFAYFVAPTSPLPSASMAYYVAAFMLGFSVLYMLRIRSVKPLAP